MTKNELTEFRDLQKEIKRLNRRLKNLNDINYEKIADTVKGSSAEFPYTQHSIQIEGIDFKRKFDGGRRNLNIERLEKILSNQVNKSMERTVAIAEFICNIEQVKIRTIFEYRYYDLMTWQQIAFMLEVTDESYPRRLHDNYLKQVRISPNE